MPENPCPSPAPEKWARFRFSVVGPLLAAPPAPGELQGRLQALCAQKWCHPLTGQWVQYGASTIERWYYTALHDKQDPVAALRRQRRSDLGQHPSLSAEVRAHLLLQYQAHPQWSYQLHADNLAVLAQQQDPVAAQPGYASVLRFMKAHGLLKRPRRGPAHSPGAQVAEHRFASREVRSYQSEYVNALWHLDFHHGSLRVLLDRGQWVYPLLLGCLDDHSRLCGHAQWYLSEGAEELCHGVGQGFQKRALPRALMTDNGAAMLAAETQEGLARLGILHETTLPYSPYQNGKQEVFWGQIEGRLLPMLEGVPDLSLRQLNEATLAWVEMEYNRKVHSELGTSPLQCYLHHKDVGRPCPESERLQQAFTKQLHRLQRRSDGTIRLEGQRFEIPGRYHHWTAITVRLATWDLSRVFLCDPHSGAILCRLYPQDKTRNAQGQRAARIPPAGLALPTPAAVPGPIAPLLQKLLKDYATTGLPPAYLPKDELTPQANPS